MATVNKKHPNRAANGRWLKGCEGPNKAGVSGYYVKHPDYQKCRDMAMDFAPRAMEILMDLAEISPHEPTRKNACSELLNRSLGPPKPVDLETGETSPSAIDMSKLSVSQIETLLTIFKELKQNENAVEAQAIEYN